jgi:hypothetical protein
MERRNLLKALLASPLALFANRSEASAGPKEHPVLGELKKVTLLGFMENEAIRFDTIDGPDPHPMVETIYPIECSIELEFTKGDAVFQAFNVHLEDAILIRDNVGRLIDVTAMTLKQAERAVRCSSEFTHLPMGGLEEVVIGKARFKMSSYSYNVDV